MPKRKFNQSSPPSPRTHPIPYLKTKTSERECAPISKFARIYFWLKPTADDHQPDPVDGFPHADIDDKDTNSSIAESVGWKALGNSATCTPFTNIDVLWWINRHCCDEEEDSYDIDKAIRAVVLAMKAQQGIQLRLMKNSVREKDGEEQRLSAGFQYKVMAKTQPSDLAQGTVFLVCGFAGWSLC